MHQIGLLLRLSSEGMGTTWQNWLGLRPPVGIKSRYPAARTVMGLSNISYGLSNRKLVNRTF